MRKYTRRFLAPYLTTMLICVLTAPRQVALAQADLFHSNTVQPHPVISDVDEDAVVINIGMLLLGKGKAWLDDVSLEDLGRVVVRAEPPRPLTARGLENLVAFTRLLGYVRHLHPSDEGADADWNSF